MKIENKQRELIEEYRQRWLREVTQNWEIEFTDLLSQALAQKEEEVMREVEQKIITLRGFISYAIGHGQGCGHRITYLEKNFPELTREKPNEK